MEQEKKQQSYWSWSSLFNWKLDSEELKNQVENYNTLSFSKSLRKLSAGLIALGVALSIVFLMFGYSQEVSLIDAIMWAVLAVLVYKGKGWAITVAIILWTLEKGYQIYGMTYTTTFRRGFNFKT